MLSTLKSVNDSSKKKRIKIIASVSTASGILILGLVFWKVWKKRKNKVHVLKYSQAWLLWNDGRALELMDTFLEDSFIESQVKRCTQVGLLCAQKFPESRPDISSVVFMLANEDVVLPRPREPGFFTERGFSTDTSSSKDKSLTGNYLSVTIEEGR
ncbi:hypothetical protein Patl1_04502 [Pistacia atlantica]|uniref:Uncharacterized protein n=1 Tax=Pistacia atlantica TaxID=434234 RepID=A0ACC1BUT8_9ROSI|nr:hypothetical protein Patl1_04502 [Pistacia atlantica]